MARTKKKNQKLGGKLQSARAKHDTALEQEILGQIAAQKSAKADVQAKKAVANKKTGSATKRKTVEVSKGELGKKGNADGGNLSVSGPSKHKHKHISRREQLTDLLSSGLGVDDAQCGEIIKRAKHHLTMKQMFDAAVDAHESTAGQFTEEDFLAKAEEYTGPGPQGSDPAAKAARKERKKERKARKEANKAKNSNKAKVEAGNRAAKRAAKKAAKDGIVVSELASAHNPEPSQVYQEVSGEHDGTGTSNKGFSVEFWMDLAGSRAAAAIAAT